MCHRKQLSVLEIHAGPQCNLNCVFCYRRGQCYRVRRPLVAEERIRSLIAEFAAQGGRQLNLSGGLEPFTRPELSLSVIRSAHAHGLDTHVYTNGACRALADEQVCLLLALHADRVRFSIHGISAPTYQAVARPARNSVSLRQIKRTVQQVVDASSGSSTQVGIAFLVIRENAAELCAAAELWRRAGVDFFDVRFDVTAAGTSSEEVCQAVRQLREQVRAGRLQPLQVNIGEPTQEKRLAARCWAAREKLVVDPFGLMWSCCMLAHPGVRPQAGCLGDINTCSLAEILQRVDARFPRPHCRRCTPWEAGYNLQQEQASIRELATTG